MESEIILHSRNIDTEQLINSMMSFLDEPTERYEEFDDSKNPLCAGIKNIIETFPVLSFHKPKMQNLNTSFQSRREDPKTLSYNNRTNSTNFEKSCRHKDPYMQEVNRLMFCSTMGHPLSGSPEHFKAAENYALYGKDFLDFPINIKFPNPMDVSCFDGDLNTQPFSSFIKSNPSQGFGMQAGKYPSLTNTSVTQLPVMMNSANYWGYPFYQNPNLIPPLMYSNPFLITQYLNMFVRETQINTSIVQQQQFLNGGIHERLVYAQMLQQQIQTNKSAQVSFSNFQGCSAAGLGKPNPNLQDEKKVELVNQICVGNDFMKTNLNGNNSVDKNLDLYH